MCPTSSAMTICPGAFELQLEASASPPGNVGRIAQRIVQRTVQAASSVLGTLVMTLAMEGDTAASVTGLHSATSQVFLNLLFLDRRLYALAVPRSSI
jgi:hypothetical protein